MVVVNVIGCPLVSLHPPFAGLMTDRNNLHKRPRQVPIQITPCASALSSALLVVGESTPWGVHVQERHGRMQGKGVV